MNAHPSHWEGKPYSQEWISCQALSFLAGTTGNSYRSAAPWSHGMQALTPHLQGHTATAKIYWIS